MFGLLTLPGPQVVRISIVYSNVQYILLLEMFLETYRWRRSYGRSRAYRYGVFSQIVQGQIFKIQNLQVSLRQVSAICKDSDRQYKGHTKLWYRKCFQKPSSDEEVTDKAAHVVTVCYARNKFMYLVYTFSLCTQLNPDE